MPAVGSRRMWWKDRVRKGQGCQSRRKTKTKKQQEQEEIIVAERNAHQCPEVWERIATEFHLPPGFYNLFPSSPWFPWSKAVTECPRNWFSRNFGRGQLQEKMIIWWPALLEYTGYNRMMKKEVKRLNSQFPNLATWQTFLAYSL